MSPDRETLHRVLQEGGKNLGEEFTATSSTDILVMPDRVIPETRSCRFALCGSAGSNV
jgi:hypothetical protein